MERSDTRSEVNQLDLIINEYMPDHMPDRFWQAYGKLVAFAKQAGWPREIHKQYMKALDERDKLQERVDELEEEISLMRVDSWKYRDLYGS